MQQQRQHGAGSNGAQPERRGEATARQRTRRSSGLRQVAGQYGDLAGGRHRLEPGEPVQRRIGHGASRGLQRDSGRAAGERGSHEQATQQFALRPQRDVGRGQEDAGVAGQR